MKKTILLFVLLCYGLFVFSQRNENTKSALETSSKISFGVELGTGILGLSRSMKEILKKEYFNDKPPCFNIFGGSCPTYPKGGENIFLGIKFNYSLQPDHDIGTIIGFSNYFKLEGSHSNFGYLTFAYREYSFAPYYRLSPKDKLYLEVGVLANLLNLERTDDEKYLDSESKYQWLRPGAMIGFQIPILERESGYMRLGSRYKILFGKVSIGPFHFQDHRGDVKPGIEKKELRLKEFQIYISFGRKF